MRQRDQQKRCDGSVNAAIDPSQGCPPVGFHSRSYAIAMHKILSFRPGTKYGVSVSCARSTALTLTLAVSLAAHGVAQTTASVGVKCAEPHSGQPTAPWRDNGNHNGVWVAACQGSEKCDLLIREHNCAYHPRLCQGSTSTTTDNLTDIVADGVGRAVAALPNDQAIAAIGGLALLGAMLNSGPSPAAKAAAARAAAEAHAAEEEAARVRAEEQARKDRETREYLEKNLKDQIDAPRLAAKVETGIPSLAPKHTGAFGTNLAPANAISTTTRPQSARDVNTAWKQLWCANEIAGKAARATALEDIVYLANETRGAMEGVSFGEGCKPAPAVPTISPDAMSRRAEALKTAVGELTAAAGKAAAVIPPAPPPPAAVAAPPTGDAKVIADALKTQREFQAADQARIDEVKRQQDEYQRKRDADLKPVRDAQKAINELGALPDVPAEQ